MLTAVQKQFFSRAHQLSPRHLGLIRNKALALDIRTLYADSYLRVGETRVCPLFCCRLLSVGHGCSPNQTLPAASKRRAEQRRRTETRIVECALFLKDVKDAKRCKRAGWE